MKYTSHVWSIIIHGVLAMLWYFYSDFIIEFEDNLNQPWVMDAMIYLVSIALFAYLYKKLVPNKYELTIGWLVGFFPVLALMMFFVY